MYPALIHVHMFFLQNKSLGYVRHGHYVLYHIISNLLLKKPLDERHRTCVIWSSHTPQAHNEGLILITGVGMLVTEAFMFITRSYMYMRKMEARLLDRVLLERVGD